MITSSAPFAGDMDDAMRQLLGHAATLGLAYQALPTVQLRQQAVELAQAVRTVIVLCDLEQASRCYVGQAWGTRQ